MEHTATRAEIQSKAHWIHAFLSQASRDAPFSFMYGGRSSRELLRVWPKQTAVVQLSETRTQHIITWSDPQTGLETRCVAVDDAEYPTVEWTLSFRNAGTDTTPVLEQIRAIDLQVPQMGHGPVVLRHNRGDTCGPDAYEPLQQVLAAGEAAQFAPVGGRPTSLAFPYFNLHDDVGGCIIALGWPGQWSARFACDGQRRVHVCGGQEQTHFVLYPGEEARAPLAALLFWQGHHVRAQNLWRQWMLAHNLPRRHGQLPPMMSAMCRGLHQNEAGEQDSIDLLSRHHVGLDYWWMDAGWYTGQPGPLAEWAHVGTWEPDRERFPHGIAAVAEYAHARAMKLVLWFELERVSPGSAWRQHEEWLLALAPEDRRFRRGGEIGTPAFTREEAERNQIRDDDRLLNLGHPDALGYLIEFMSSCISHWGIDLFRLDFNIAPLLFWRAADAPDRQGMTENAYVRGLLRFFDTLLQRHPDLVIDSCASGGRRIDLETMRRAVVNTRSDYWCISPTADQCQTHGIASWLPHYMCAGAYADTYRFHSNLAPSMGFDGAISQQDGADWPLFRQRVADWRRLAPCFWGDYYPLTPWNNRDDAWLAWQFYRPEHGDGLLQFFRRRDDRESVQTFRIQGLDPSATYELRNIDTGGQVFVTGKEVAEQGLRVEINDTPGSVVFALRATAQHEAP